MTILIHVLVQGCNGPCRRCGSTATSEEGVTHYFLCEPEWAIRRWPRRKYKPRGWPFCTLCWFQGGFPCNGVCHAVCTFIDCGRCSGWEVTPVGLGRTLPFWMNAGLSRVLLDLVGRLPMCGWPHTSVPPDWRDGPAAALARQLMADPRDNVRWLVFADAFDEVAGRETEVSTTIRNALLRGTVKGPSHPGSRPVSG
jgi:hypothetical protein